MGNPVTSRMDFARRYVTLVAVLLAGCAPPGGATPDLILVVMDTTRADRLGVYGNPESPSPRLDELARDGTVYGNAWSTASWTLPSHASIFTGLYPSAHGARITPDVDQDSLGENPPRLSSSAVTLAELLLDAGYHTAAIASAGWLAPEFGLLQGYQLQDAVNLRSLPANEVTDRAIAWLQGIPDGEPFHLMVNYFDPHDPAPPPGFHGRESLEPIEPPALDAERGAVLSDGQRAAYLDRYDGSIRFLDFHVGRLLDALRAAGRFDDAIIVVTADHGEHFGEHGAMGHGAWLYEEVLHVPLIVRMPGGRDAGARVDDPVSLVDLLPLVAREIGLPVPEGVEDHLPGAREIVLAEEYPTALLKKIFGARLDRDLVAGIRWPWKLIVSSAGGSELYRLDEDPDESTPLENPDVEREMIVEIEQTLRSLARTAPDPDAEPMSPELEIRLRELGYIE